MKLYPGLRAGPMAAFAATARAFIPADITDETRALTNLPAMPLDGKKRFVIAASSEYPVERMNWMGERWREVLDHQPASVQMGRFSSGRAAVLEEHGGVPIGVIDASALGSDNKLRTIVRFSKSVRGQEAEADMEDDIRTNSSIGYLPKSAVLVEENKELGDLWRVTQWEPLELSVVGIPADPTVGVGRNMSDALRYAAGLAGAAPAVPVNKEVQKMKKVRGENGAIIEVPDDDPRPAYEPAAVIRTEASGLTREQIVEVCEIGDENKIDPKIVRGWLAAGLTPEQASRDVLKIRATTGTAQPASEHIDLSTKDRKRYSYSRAILSAADRGGQPDGLEGEVSQEIQRHLGPDMPRRGGVYVPLQLGDVRMETSKRTLASNIVTKGTEFVYEQPNELIELLRNRTVVLNMGARFLSGLSAPIAFPKQTGAMAASWVGENPGSNVGASDIVLGLALLAPKALQATGAYSRQLLATSTIDVEMMVRDELSIVHSIAVDFAALHGLGAAGEPTGIYKAIGASTQAFGGAASYQMMVNLLKKVAGLNADLGTLGFITHTTVAGNLMVQLTFGNVAASTPVWNGTIRDAVVAGYRAAATNQVSSTMTGVERTGGTELGVIFGNWADLIIGSFGALELIVDPYALKKQGIIEVTSFQMADILCRHGESFAVSTGCTG